MYLGLFSSLGFTDAQGETRSDAQLRSYARQFLDDYYDVVGVPGMTIAQLKDKIVDYFVKNSQEEESAPVTFSPSGSRSLDQFVKMLSPLSRMKSGIVFVQTRLPAPTRPVTAPSNVLFGPGCAPGTEWNAAKQQCVAVVDSGRLTSRVIPVLHEAPPDRPAVWVDLEGRTRPDSELEGYARWFLDTYYNLRPVGTETLSELKARIMDVFLRHQGVTTSGATFDSEIGPVQMDEVVRAVSPLSTYKPRGVSIATKQQVQSQGPAALTKPGAGKKAATFNWTELLKLVESTMVGYGNIQKQQAAAQLMAVQQRGQPLYVDPQTEQHVKQSGPGNAWLYATIGIVALGIVGFFLLKD